MTLESQPPAQRTKTTLCILDYNHNKRSHDFPNIPVFEAPGDFVRTELNSCAQIIGRMVCEMNGVQRFDVDGMRIIEADGSSVQISEIPAREEVAWRSQY